MTEFKTYKKLPAVTPDLDNKLMMLATRGQTGSDGPVTSTPSTAAPAITSTWQPCQRLDLQGDVVNALPPLTPQPVQLVEHRHQMGTSTRSTQMWVRIEDINSSAFESECAYLHPQPITVISPRSPAHVAAGGRLSGSPRSVTGILATQPAGVLPFGLCV